MFEDIQEIVFWSASLCEGGTCVEVALFGSLVLVRDSKNLSVPVLTFDQAEWRAFVAGVKQGEFDVD
jgi:hypothetical protein